MEKLFRLLVVLSMLGYLILWFLPFFEYPWLSAESVQLLSYSGFDATMKLPLIFQRTIFFAWLVVSIGLLFFEYNSRALFVVLYIIDLVMAPISGMLVLSGIGAFLFSLIGLIDGAIIAIAYLTSIANKFEKKHKEKSNEHI